MGDHLQIPINKIAVLGNQHLSRTILEALMITQPTHLTLITHQSQDPYLPADICGRSIIHKTTDFTQHSLEQVLQGCNLVISTTSGGDFELQKRIVDACITSSVERFVANEFGLDSQNPLVQDRLPGYKARGDLIEYLRTKQDQLKWIAVAVGTVLDHELLNGKLGFDLKWHSASIPGERTTKIPATSLARVGELIVAITSNWSKVHNTYLYASGCITRVDEILKVLERETGAEWVVDHNDPRDLLKSAERMLDGGWPDAGWTLLERIVLFDPTTNGIEHFSKQEANSLLDMASETIENVVQGAVRQWEHTTRGDCGCN